jgi:glutaredoxin
VNNEVIIFARRDCSYGKRAWLHCRLLEIENQWVMFDRPDGNELVPNYKSPSIKRCSKMLPDKTPEPFIFVNEEYIGGYYELLERFPIASNMVK